MGDDSVVRLEGYQGDSGGSAENGSLDTQCCSASGNKVLSFRAQGLPSRKSFCAKEFVGSDVFVSPAGSERQTLSIEGTLLIPTLSKSYKNYND